MPGENSSRHLNENSCLRFRAMMEPYSESRLFGEEDLAFIGQHRGDGHRLGVGIQLCYLRHPARVLGSDEAPSAQLLGLVELSSDFLLMFGTSMPNAMRRGAEHLQRSWSARP